VRRLSDLVVTNMGVRHRGQHGRPVSTGSGMLKRGMTTNNQKGEEPQLENSAAPLTG